MSDIRAATWDQERAYEQAKDVLDSLFGNRSGWIYQEKLNPHPDEALIIHWEQEQNSFEDRRQALDIFNNVQIKSTIDELRPQLMSEKPITAACGAALVREHLAVLGLAFRIEGGEVPDCAWLPLLKLTANVIAHVKHTRPEQNGKSLCVAEMEEAPDAGGWIYRSLPVDPPYWISKADYPKLLAVRHLLDILVLPTAKVELALKGLIGLENLNGEEQEEYFERFDDLLSKPSALEDAFFKDRQERGLGVGMDEAGNIVYATPKKSDSL